ncbi:MAG: glycosyltransferase family 2 protein [Chlamydiia bacterium]|nr:glycosyltransferase family 2 protein [Chlamydiia bacterium]
MVKVSILIPTRERAFYLPACLRTALAIPDPDIEVVIADNASTDNTAEVVATFDDPRIVYLPSDARVSMRENFNRALAASRGDYAIVIGDDDAILPGQFAHLRHLLDTHQPDGISWFKFTYGWPIEGYGKKTGGIRFYREDCFVPPVAYDPKDDLAKLLSCDLNALYPTPNIYHGCVSRAYLERLAPAPGLYFDSTIPDVNLQYRATLSGGRFLHLHHPMSINGHSPHSNGGSQAAAPSGSERAKIAAKFESENRADPWDDILDHAQTIQMVFFATLETVRERGGFTDIRPDYDKWYSFALGALRQKPEHAERIRKALEEHAQRTGTTAELARATAVEATRKRSWSDRLKRWRSQAASFRLSAALDGVNDVDTAAQVCDGVLGADYAAVIAGQMPPARAWAQARTRAKGFTRTL